MQLIINTFGTSLRRKGDRFIIKAGDKQVAFSDRAYSLFAFFNSIDEDGKAGNNAKPYLKYKSPSVDRSLQEAQRWAKHRSKQESLAKSQAEQGFADWLDRQVARVWSRFQPWHPLRARVLHSVEGTELAQDADGVIQASSPSP